MIYEVIYLLDETQRSENFEAHGPGEAFALCLKRYPQATLIGATTYGRIGQEEIKTSYDPPPVQRPVQQIRMGPRKPRKNDPEGKLDV